MKKLFLLSLGLMAFGCAAYEMKSNGSIRILDQKKAEVKAVNIAVKYDPLKSSSTTVADVVSDALQHAKIRSDAKVQWAVITVGSINRSFEPQASSNGLPFSSQIGGTLVAGSTNFEMTISII